MNDVQRRAVASLRREGYLVVVFNPVELSSIPKGEVVALEESLMQKVNDTIDLIEYRSKKL